MHLSQRSTEDTQESFQTYLQNYYQILMITWSQSNIILAIIGMIGLFSTATVVSYGFKRNRTGNGRYQ